MTKYVAPICSYVDDPDQGDPDAGIDAGTKFEDLHNDWVCLECGARKAQPTISSI